MAVSTKEKDTRLKVKKAKPGQLETVDTGEKADQRKYPDAQMKDRGIGSSFAMALGNILEDAKEFKKAAKAGFLGKPSEVIDPKEYSQSLTKSKGDK